MTSVVKFLLIVFLPLVLRQLTRTVTALRNWREHIVFYRTVTKFEKICLILSLMYSAVLLKSILIPQQYYFSITKTPVNSPSYLIRNRFRSFVEEKAQKDVKFHDMIKARKKIIGDSTDAEMIYKVYTEERSLETEYIKIEKLSMELRNKETRHRYCLYGPDSLDCAVCSPQGWSHFALIAPKILLEYILSLLFIVLVCMFPRKQRWKNYSICAAIITIALESLEWIASDDSSIFLSSLIPNNNYLTKPEQLSIVRKFLLLSLNIIMVVIDLPIVQNTVQDSLKQIIEQTEQVAAKLQYSRIARIAIALDDNLFEFDSKNRKKQDGEIKDYFQTPELKSLRTELAQKHNLQDTMTSEQKFITTFQNWF